MDRERKKRGQCAVVDIKGRRFGRWTVLARAGNHGRRVRWLCECDCGTIRIVRGDQIKDGRSKSCGCLHREAASREAKSRTGSRHSQWKGGYQDKNGYKLVLDHNHPNADKNGYVPEHVKTMSEHLGRPMRKGETVHHINGIRNDNRLENLELWASHHPPGQRISDQLAWAKQLLTEYEPWALA